MEILTAWTEKEQVPTPEANDTSNSISTSKQSYKYIICICTLFNKNTA